MRIRGLAKAVIFQAEHNPIITISFLGRMGRGKTNCMRYLAKHLMARGYRVFYVQSPPPERFGDVLEAVRGAGDRIALFLDDMSFEYSGATKEVKTAENLLARIRHIVETGDTGHLVVGIAFHYLRAINPFVRISDITILFDLTTEYEIDMYEEVFSRRMLREFMRIYSMYRWRSPKLLKKMSRRGMDPDRWRPVLAKVIDKEVIAWIPYVSPSEVAWNIVDLSNAQSTENKKRDEKPPITWSEFRKRIREEFGIRAAEQKLWNLYKWLFEDLLGFKIPTRNPEKLLSQQLS